MYIDFHTHGKLAKKLPFSKEYTHWLFAEAKNAGLDAICLTEHFNTLGFADVYQYIAEHSDKDGDTLIFDGLRIFPGMETDILEGGHILSIGPMEKILELNRQLEMHKQKNSFMTFEELMKLFETYSVIVGGAHPFREGGHIPELPMEQLSKLDFFDLNGKDIAEKQVETLEKTAELATKLNKPVVCGSDTHQAVQYGCIKSNFFRECNTVDELYREMCAGAYENCISEQAAFQVKTAGILKRALKEIHELQGDYVSVLLGK